MPQVTRPVSPEVLRALSEHVLYEIEMVARTTELLSPHHWENVPEGIARGVHNALLESFTIHVRALQSFLCGTPQRNDDAVASDYFPAGAWEEIRHSERSS